MDIFNNLKNNSDEVVGAKSVFSRFLIVIAGRVPAILVQRVTNLVRKLAVLFKSSMLRQDSRDRPENDWCWGRLFMFFPFLKLFNRMYHPGASANELALKAKDDYKSVSQHGRSMIEMLGVLAIIGVLSVGGIAGYSKAMEKYKVNKTIAEYAYLFQGLIEHIDEFHALSKPNEGDIHYGVAGAANSLNLIPKTWRFGSNSIDVYDEHDNWLRIFSRNSNLVIDMYLGGFQVDEDGFAGSMNFSPKFCAELLSNVVRPLHSSLYYVYITNVQNAVYYGDNLCSSNRKCISDITLAEIQKMCNSCGKKQRCGVIFEF